MSTRIPEHDGSYVLTPKEWAAFEASRTSMPGPTPGPTPVLRCLTVVDEEILCEGCNDRLLKRLAYVDARGFDARCMFCEEASLSPSGPDDDDD